MNLRTAVSALTVAALVFGATFGGLIVLDWLIR